MTTTNRLTITFSILLTLVFFNAGQAQDDKGSGKKKKADHKFTVEAGSKNYDFTASSDWKKIKPKFDFYQAEFNLPKAEGDEKEGRITFSVVGGTIDQNLERWVGQFKGLDEGDENSLKKMNKEVNGAKVQLIHIQGTFMDSAGGPFGPKTERENYVLMGAAIETGGGANVYIKAYGPKKTMEANHNNLKAMLDSLKVSGD